MWCPLPRKVSGLVDSRGGAFWPSVLVDSWEKGSLASSFLFGGGSLFGPKVWLINLWDQVWWIPGGGTLWHSDLVDFLEGDLFGP